ncbi:MAG TPA: hypothetical protein VGB99_17890 [Acidobacteriota bacterium]
MAVWLALIALVAWQAAPDSIRSDSELADPIENAPADPSRPFKLDLRASTLNAYSPAYILLDAQLEGGSDSDERLSCPKLQWKLTGVKEIDTIQRRAYTQDDQFWDRAATVSPASPSPTRERRKLSTVTRRPRKCDQAEGDPTIPRLFHHELNLNEPGTYWIQAVLVGADDLKLNSDELRIRILPGIRDP